MSNPNFQVLVHHHHIGWIRNWFERMWTRWKARRARLQSIGKKGGVTVIVQQRQNGKLVEAFTIQCYAGDDGILTTVVESGELTRFKKRSAR